MVRHIQLDRQKVAAFCHRHFIRRLSVFGSALHEDFRWDSEVDVLVEFQKGHVPGLEFFAMQQELSELINHKVDLNTPEDLSPYTKRDILDEAEVQFDTA